MGGSRARLPAPRLLNMTTSWQQARPGASARQLQNSLLREWSEGGGGYSAELHREVPDLAVEGYYWLPMQEDLNGE